VIPDVRVSKSREIHTENGFLQRRAFKTTVLIRAGVFGIGLEDLRFKGSRHFDRLGKLNRNQIACDEVVKLLEAEL
ncbi:hypothetical protein, partial [Escherichia coli]|uniref:hypothetical protein n=1 Tax=Escherichia coli TaxID=562 RepID=UPI001BDCF8B5